MKLCRQNSTPNQAQSSPINFHINPLREQGPKGASMLRQGNRSTASCLSMEPCKGGAGAVSTQKVSMLSDFQPPLEVSQIWSNNAAPETLSPSRSALTTATMEDPLNSRIFVVCGKSIEVRCAPLQCTDCCTLVLM